MNRELRQQLETMTLKLSVAEHSATLEKLRAEFGHSVEIVASEHPIEEYTCVVHAFSLVNDPTYVEVASFGLGRTFAGADFIRFVLKHDLLKARDSTNCAHGDFVMYFQEGLFQHVGRLMTRDRALSKWGTGHLYKHGLWEVPFTYGEEVRMFKCPNKERCLELFIAYAED
ncbi:hypothetical protein [uncultured Desulfobacter sp.]|uniref:hypothetical protein n=1 Tax=uncultured Desulfobacter sp. TaxID=240139 RepID=UPI0029C63C4C|nr:hypothetical protein [uncultured Desulfobacter sp.]